MCGGEEMKENVFERMERIDGQRKISDFIVKQNRRNRIQAFQGL